ncbi:MAG: hypothetical protein JWP89_3551 [Schlesneria sp.]|nr:hypothetical protein [Schlesneria sp.]
MSSQRQQPPDSRLCKRSVIDVVVEFELGGYSLEYHIEVPVNAKSMDSH